MEFLYILFSFLSLLFYRSLTYFQLMFLILLGFVGYSIHHNIDYIKDNYSQMKGLNRFKFTIALCIHQGVKNILCLLYKLYYHIIQQPYFENIQSTLEKVEYKYQKIKKKVLQVAFSKALNLLSTIEDDDKDDDKNDDTNDTNDTNQLDSDDKISLFLSSVLDDIKDE